jgi:FtsP/CotA-like multicopper oxidase with cupredoxin domain
MATSFSGRGSRSTRREPPTMGKQLVNFITCGCESSAHFFVIYKAGRESAAPTVEILQPTYSVTTGDSITLECTVTSNLPVTSVQWERNVDGTITTITSTTDLF